MLYFIKGVKTDNLTGSCFLLPSNIFLVPPLYFTYVLPFTFIISILFMYVWSSKKERCLFYSDEESMVTFQCTQCVMLDISHKLV